MNRSPTQTSFYGAVRADPLRGRLLYYPILQSLPGELEALGHASATAWGRMTPVIEVTTLGGDPMTISPHSPLARLGKSLAESITPEHLFFLSFHERMRGRVIEKLLDQCLAYGLAFVPVISLQTLERADLLRRKVGFDRGVCIRMRLAGRLHQTGLSLGDQLERVLDATVGDAGTADLLFDLGYLSQSPGFRPEHVIRALEQVTSLERWRSAAIAGTVIPETLSAVAEQDHVVRLDRHDWSYYLSVRRSSLARQLSFADYAVQNPERPAGGRGAMANIRYTTREAVIIARGHKVTAADHAQYNELSRQIVDDEGFSGKDYSWGDQEIARFAMGDRAPLWQDHWRAYGTSHHLELMTEEVASLE